jgi:hypothetical protein
MKPEKRQLLDDLFAGGGPEAGLAAAGRILRRRRRWRTARGAFALVVFLAAPAATLWFASHRSNPSPSVPAIQAALSVRATAPAIVPAASGAPAASAQRRSLTDDELLALFPNTPVGLATLPGGRKLLIFPRPADEARFLGRL